MNFVINLFPWLRHGALREKGDTGFSQKQDDNDNKVYSIISDSTLVRDAISLRNHEYHMRIIRTQCKKSEISTGMDLFPVFIPEHDEPASSHPGQTRAETDPDLLMLPQHYRLLSENFLG
ncbi:MAG: hypothetical protein ACK5NN_10655 [Sphingomonadaceae bacterium]